MVAGLRGVVGISGTEVLLIIRCGTGGVVAMDIDNDGLLSIGSSGAATSGITLALACGMGPLKLAIGAGGVEAPPASTTLAEAGGVVETLLSCGTGGVAAPMTLLALLESATIVLPGGGTMRGVVATADTPEGANGGTTSGVGPLVIL